MIEQYAIAVLGSALLYRWPRGTGLQLPEGHTLSKIPKNAELPWAVGSALLFYWATGNIVALCAAPLLIAGEAPGWSKWWPNNTEHEPRYWVRMMKLNLRGVLLLNPFMGFIDFAVHESKIPGDKRIVGELLSGAVTASVSLAIIHFCGGALEGVLRQWLTT